MPGCTHHFNVVKDSRHLLYSLHHLLRILGIFCFSRHLFIKRHLPAHCWVLHLKYNTSMCIMNRMNRFIQECVYYLLSLSKEIKSLPTLPCRCRLLCKNSLTSSSVSFYELKKPRFGGHLQSYSLVINSTQPLNKFGKEKSNRDIWLWKKYYYYIYREWDKIISTHFVSKYMLTKKQRFCTIEI